MNLFRCGKQRQIIELGSGKTFDLKTLAPNIDYTKLSVDNFYIKSIPSQVISAWHSYHTYGDGNTWVNITPTKTYDKSTGVLTCKFNVKCTGSMYGRDDDFNTEVVLIR